MKKLLSVLVLSLPLIGCGSSSSDNGDNGGVIINGWSLEYSTIKEGRDYDHYCRHDFTTNDCAEPAYYLAYEGQPLDTSEAITVHHLYENFLPVPKPVDGEEPIDAHHPSLALNHHTEIETIRMVDGVETEVYYSNNFEGNTEQQQSTSLETVSEGNDLTQNEWFFTAHKNDNGQISFQRSETVCTMDYENDSSVCRNTFLTRFNCTVNGDIYECTEQMSGDYVVITEQEINEFRGKDEAFLKRDNAKIIWNRFFDLDFAH